jgi:hypothetical protein
VLGLKVIWFQTFADFFGGLKSILGLLASFQELKRTLKNFGKLSRTLANFQELKQALKNFSKLSGTLAKFQEQ